jgi:predicted nucleotidyltransferase
MTWRVPPFDTAADELVAYARATYAPLGIVLAGSIIRGEADPTSDFDCFIVHDEPWRLREQKRFAGVPAELFVNPAAQVRRYFASEHGDGRPCTAHMFATGEIVLAHPIIDELVREARESLARPLEVSEESLMQQRYGIVDTLDDTRDVLHTDAATASLLIADAVRGIVAYAFWKRHQFQPRRKATISALAAIDPEAAALVRRWQSSSLVEGWAVIEALARHVLGVDTFFEWTSARDPVTR